MPNPNQPGTIERLATRAAKGLLNLTQRVIRNIAQDPEIRTQAAGAAETAGTALRNATTQIAEAFTGQFGEEEETETDPQTAQAQQRINRIVLERPDNSLFRQFFGHLLYAASYIGRFFGFMLLARDEQEQSASPNVSQQPVPAN